MLDTAAARRSYRSMAGLHALEACLVDVLRRCLSCPFVTQGSTLSFELFGEMWELRRQDGGDVACVPAGNPASPSRSPGESRGMQECTASLPIQVKS